MILQLSGETQQRKADGEVEIKLISTDLIAPVDTILLLLICASGREKFVLLSTTAE